MKGWVEVFYPCSRYARTPTRAKLLLFLIQGFSFQPFNSQDLIVNSPLLLLHISLLISYENLVLDQDDNLYLRHLSILITCLLDSAWICREKLLVDHFWEVKD